MAVSGGVRHRVGRMPEQKEAGLRSVWIGTPLVVRTDRSGKPAAPEPLDPGIRRQRHRMPQTGYLTAFTIASNAFGSFIAKSAMTLRLRAIPLALTLPMNSE